MTINTQRVTYECVWYVHQRGTMRSDRASQPQWIAPLLARCWRYVLTKKGDDEEGERLHSWLPGERIAAAYYYIKQLGGPHSPQIMGDAFPVMTQYGDAYQLRPTQGMLHVFDDVTAQTPVGNCREAALCSEFRWEDRGGGHSSEGNHGEAQVARKISSNEGQKLFETCSSNQFLV